MNTFYNLIKFLFIFGYWLMIAGVTLRILIKRRTVPSAMAWLLIIYILPLVGIIAYLSFGEPHLGKRRAERARIMWPATEKWLNDLKQLRHIFATEHSDVARSLFQLCQNRQGIAGVKGNQLQLLTSSDDVMQALIRDIQLARHNIEMVFYIWHPGGLADDVAESLIAASRRGVYCRLMLDSAGSITFFRSPWVGMMRNAGIDVVEALQVSLLRVFLRRMDLRQHRKVVLIDNYIAYTGSMNLVDPRYFKQDAGVGQWTDLMARMKGPVATTIGIVYSCDWEIETGKRILPPPPDGNIMPFEQGSGHTVQFIASGFGFPENMIHQALLTAIYSAREQLSMTTPYFVPSDDLLHAICTASLRGVEVSIIIPRHNDSMLVSWASRAFFSELLDAGVKIYQFEDGLLHTKSVLVDGQLSLVGTVNLDMRSLWLNFEITLVVDDASFGNDIACVQDDYIARSCLLDANRWTKRAWWQRIVERLFYFFSPLL
ncbi:cardiolipin synthase [Pantoea sp. Nvir]|uniref:cardiolipin synthase n=1 Tax=Pantoea sp. Nvir TaxID=2576760 RepID=UPI00135B5864|nr:cardiolipin synthase [Pantoea sp. Nvir]MXP66692.1 cardiolipin synthase [Pantoea sp. Nvir]CAJ0991822.1 Cardiolipin synthase A [Pantoea sp. Nvir]